MTSIALNEDTLKAFDSTNNVKRDAGQQGDDPTSLLVMAQSGNDGRKKAAAQMLKDWDDSWKDVKGIKEQWKANKARYQGFTGVELVKKQDHSECYIPRGAKKNVSGLNKASRLCRRLRATMFADPPMAEAVPSGDEDEARDAAETSTRVLQNVSSEGQLSLTLGYGDAFDLGAVYGSGFVRFWPDMNGGGWVPKQVEAYGYAVDATDPKPDVDPTTGQPGSTETTLRYVTEDDQFTEDRTQAARQWLPKLKRELLTGKNVRFIPWQVRDIWEADGCHIGCAITLGEIKRQFPWVAKWSTDRQQKLISTRPQFFDTLIPAGRKDNQGTQGNRDDALCFLLTRYHVQSVQYPEGAYLIAGGSDELLCPSPDSPEHDGTWFDKLHAEPLDIPVTQLKQLTEEDNPYGKGAMEDLGPGNEIRGAVIGQHLEHFDRFNNRRIFLPLISTLQAQQLQAPTGTPIPIMPGAEPKYEEIPDFPVMGEKLLAWIDKDMDDESGLQQVGQGLSPSNVKSGVHANVVREQVTQDLSDMRENCIRGMTRGWRICLQLMRAYFTDAQQFQFQGADGSFKVKRWKNSDMGDTRDVRLERGSFTQLTPTAKADIAQQYAQLGILSKPDLEHVIEGSIGGLFGLQDNPARQRVRRQISAWEEGPPDGWQPPQAPVDALGQPQVDPQTGQPVPPPPDPTLAAIFDQRSSDTEPEVAQIRTFELRRATQGTNFARWPAEWQVGIAGAYDQARQAAQVMDAQTSQKMQQELEQTKGKVAEQQAKLSEKPSLSVAVKSAMQLDEAQTLALFQQEGIQLPPGGVQEPMLDPNAEMQVQAQLQSQQIEADVVKHRTSESAKVEQARVKGQSKVQRAQSKAQRPPKQPANVTVHPATVTAPNITVNIPEKKEGAKRVTRDKDGKVSGVEPVDD